MEDSYLTELRRVESNYLSTLIALESKEEKSADDFLLIVKKQQNIAQVRRQIRGYQEQGAEIGQI